MSRKSPSQSQNLNDTLDLMTLMTHCIFPQKKLNVFYLNPAIS